MKHIFILAFLLLVVSLVSIQVSGSQSGTWSVENNPYQIIGDVTVPSGNTLTVNPGVIVQAMGVWQIIAQGNIIAIGTEADSVKFVSGMENQTTIWDGIRLENTTIQSQFSYCRIELGQYGIASINSPVSITYCYFNKNQKGIQAFGVGIANPATVLIDHNLIEYSQHNGILVAQNSNTTISYNEITNNGLTASYYGAIQLSNQSAGGSCSPEIHHNHIFNNRKQGIIAWDVANAGAIQPNVHHNLVENNLSGIYFRQASGSIYQNTVINNFITGNMNSGAGLMISGAGAAPFISENIVTGNYTGFYITENAVPVLGNPAINHPWAHGMNDIHSNIDANNVMHSVVLYQYTNSALQVYAQNNYWDYDNATQIAETITDHTDDAALSTVIFDPWQNHIIPVYLTGTVTMEGAENQPCKLQLVSANTGLILNEWDIQVGIAFNVPVYNDSLVYVIAKFDDMVSQVYYAAYGGLDSPVPTQIIADINFNVGELALGTRPNWNCSRILPTEMVGDHLSYPLVSGWFIYEPTQYFWLFRDGDYIRISRIAILYSDSTYVSFDPDDPPIWRKVTNLEDDVTWEQFYSATMLDHLVFTGTSHAITGITTQANGQPTQYDMIEVVNSHPKIIQIFDHYLDSWFTYWLHNSLALDMRIEEPFSIVTDGTLFPLAVGNIWHSYGHQLANSPTYFGYTVTDSLTFYWIPPENHVQNNPQYKLYDNGNLLSEISIMQHSFTIAIPQDGILHQYSISVANDTYENFCESTLDITFTGNEDNIVTPATLSIYPNPFSPSQDENLNIRYNFSKANQANVSIYNIKGQKVCTIKADKADKGLTWNGKDFSGKTCASGLYQIRLTNNDGKKISRKVMLLH